MTMFAAGEEQPDACTTKKTDQTVDWFTRD
jgi:hypothetical protein